MNFHGRCYDSKGHWSLTDGQQANQNYAKVQLRSIFKKCLCAQFKGIQWSTLPERGSCWARSNEASGIIQQLQKECSTGAFSFKQVKYCPSSCFPIVTLFSPHGCLKIPWEPECLQVIFPETGVTSFLLSSFHWLKNPLPSVLMRHFQAYKNCPPAPLYEPAYLFFWHESGVGSSSQGSGTPTYTASVYKQQVHGLHIY